MSLLDGLDWGNINMESVLANSYKDFHVKGFDYLCLLRTDDLTLKAYFFEDGIQDMAEVVNPHDHRYDFETECISGLVRNKWYTRTPKNLRPGRRFSAFQWDTPLNGGGGFQYSHEAMLWQDGAYTAGPGCDYPMRFNELHTIQVLRPETCIVIAQYGDKVPVGIPTHTYCAEPEEPAINDLYNTFTADQAKNRLDLLRGLIK